MPSPVFSFRDPADLAVRRHQMRKLPEAGSQLIREFEKEEGAFVAVAAVRLAPDDDAFERHPAQAQPRVHVLQRRRRVGCRWKIAIGTESACRARKFRRAALAAFCVGSVVEIKRWGQGVVTLSGSLGIIRTGETSMRGGTCQRSVKSLRTSASTATASSRRRAGAGSRRRARRFPSRPGARKAMRARAVVTATRQRAGRRSR